MTTARQDRGAGGPTDGGARPGGTADGGAWPGGPADGVADDLGARRLGGEAGREAGSARRGGRRSHRRAYERRKGRGRSVVPDGWRREFMGHGPFHCARCKPGNASCFWVLFVGVSLMAPSRCHNLQLLSRSRSPYLFLCAKTAGGKKKKTYPSFIIK